MRHSITLADVMCRKWQISELVARVGLGERAKRGDMVGEGADGESGEAEELSGAEGGHFEAKA